MRRDSSLPPLGEVGGLISSSPFLGRQFHDEAVQFLGQAFLVIVGLLSRNVDALNSRAVFECFLADFLDAGSQS